MRRQTARKQVPENVHAIINEDRRNAHLVAFWKELDALKGSDASKVFCSLFEEKISKIARGNGG